MDKDFETKLLEVLEEIKDKLDAIQNQLESDSGYV